VQRHAAQLLDDYRIWFKVTFQRGRILKTRGDDWMAYDDTAHFADPAGFFKVNGTPADISRSEVKSTPLADVSRFEFASPHEINHYGWHETNRAAGWLYRRKQGSAGVVVLSHGWAHAGLKGLEMIFIEPLLKAGWSVALLAHPFHFDRTPVGTFSGEMMVTGDVSLTVEAFRQSVADLSAVVTWLGRDRPAGDGPVGLMGYSLGGYTAALLACARGDLDFVVIGAAGDSVASVILDTGLGVNVREDLSWSGMHERQNLARAWGVISPGRMRPRVPRERILLVSGLHDRIMLPASVEALRQAWGEPPMQWEPQGHYSLLAFPGRLVRRSLPFLATRLAGQPARAGA